MSLQSQNKVDISSILFDIIRGYSVLNAHGREFYFRHMSIMLAYELENCNSHFLEQAKKSGIKTEQELVDLFIKTKSWSRQNEEEIESLKWIIDKKEKAKEKITDAIQIISINNSIDQEKRKLKDLVQKRNKLVEFSAENFASNKRIRLMLEKSIFLDQSFNEPAPYEDSVVIISKFLDKMTELADRKNIAYSAFDNSFFEIFMLNSSQPCSIFGRNPLDLTIYQKNVLIVANSLLNKFKNYSIPEEISDNPLKILEYTEKQVEDKKSKSSHNLDDLKSKSAAKGGKLTAEDFLS